MSYLLARTLACALLLFPTSLAFASAGSIAGTVVAADGTAVSDTEVRIVDLARTTRTDTNGRFTFTSVPVGAHLIQVLNPRWGGAVVEVEVTSAEALDLTLRLDRTVHSDEIFVSAGTTTRRTDEVPQGTVVLSGEELSHRLQPTLGETLANEPGITSTYFGPGSSRPLIRGLGGDRIRILQNGLDSGDASNTSPDHAAGVDPSSAERIEVLRGPATLLYGSTAIGGVVNVVSDSIPTTLPTNPIAGSLELRVGSNADNRAASTHVTGRLGQLAWHLEAFGREADDLEIPDDADLGDDDLEEGEMPGVLANSFLDSQGGTLGLAWIGTKGSFGVSVRGFDTLYGIPGGHGHEEDHDEEEEHEEGEHEEDEHDDHGDEEEETISIDLRQRRLDLRGVLSEPIGPFRTVKLNVGRVDYEHTELEGDEIGTVFENESWDARLEAAHKPIGRWSGDLGLQASSRDFSAIGAEAFVAPSETKRLALFGLERVDLGAVDLLLGARFERQDTSSSDPGLPDRDFSGVSVSAGAVWELTEGWALASNLARSTKLPTAEELYSNGPHLATNAFEIGDPDLDKEVSLGLDLSLRRTSGRVTGEISLFENRFDDYIYLEPSAEEEDSLQVFRYQQADARFRGFEAELHLELLELDPHHLELELMFDQVRAELRSSGEPLPLIPPKRYGAALLYRGDRLDGRVEVRRSSSQDRVASFETPTEGSTVVNASFGLRFFLGDSLHRIELRGTNLTDEVVRVHTSFLKDRVVAPGRDVSLMYRVDL